MANSRTRALKVKSESEGIGFESSLRSHYNSRRKKRILDSKHFKGFDKKAERERPTRELHADDIPF